MYGEFVIQGGEIFGGRTNAGVGQDKQPQTRLGSASRQPATAEFRAVGGKGGLATAAHEDIADTRCSSFFALTDFARHEPKQNQRIVRD